jgi:hypothetical protein
MTATAAPGACSTASRAAASLRLRLVDQSDWPRWRWRSPSGPRLLLDRDAEQSAAARRRHRRFVCRGARPRRPSAWSTTRSCRRCCSSPLALGADLVRALDHQVHQRPQRRGRRRRGGQGPSAAQRAGVVGQLPGPHRRALRLFLTLRGLRTLPARLRVHQENAAALASCWPRTGRGAGLLPRPGDAPWPRAGQAPAARLRRDAELRTARRRARGARTSSTACAASRWPSRSAASRAWWRIRPP